jgi:hypothetical protein
VHCQFQTSAYHVVDASNENVYTVFDSIYTLSTMTTSFLMQEHQRNNGTYPPGFVTIPDAEYHLARARHASRANVLVYAPKVEGKDYSLWSQYVEENLGWLNEVREVNHRRIEEDVFDVQAYPHDEVERQIWSVVDFDDSSLCSANQGEDLADVEVQFERPEDGPASPVWTISPPPKQNRVSRINYDLASSKLFEVMTETVSVHNEATFHDACKFTNVSSF